MSKTMGVVCRVHSTADLVIADMLAISRVAVVEPKVFVRMGSRYVIRMLTASRGEVRVVIPAK